MKVSTGLLCLLLLVSCKGEPPAPPPSPMDMRELEVAAQFCYQQGKRAILHSDFSLECRQ